MNYANDSEKKDHWEKYHLYYLIFGSFVLTTLFILIINLSINKKINSSDGDYSSFDFELKINEYSSRLNSEPFPDYVKERVKREIKKIQKSSGGPTKEIREEYVEQVMSFPWHQVSSENENLTEVEKILDEKQFGMDKVKKSIINYLGSKKQAGKNLGKVLCLVGSPGTGKTSIARYIAQALGRTFDKISVGGVHNEGEIRGHRSTYVSAKPGIIVQAFQRAKTKNPVIVVDEIDKMGESKQDGDPAAAFLEIFDPEQNEKFRDHYIELPIDLSQTMFICTANQMETISKPLLDRMEIIRVPSYTENDKKVIAKKYLIPKLLNEYNLTKEQLSFEDSAIQEIIKNYTWEAGVRNLGKKLVNIISGFSTKKVQGKLEKEVITLPKVKEYLGKPTTPNLDVEVDNKPGVVNGLSVYNPEIGGGSVLPIQVISHLGTGKIIATGNLKETMKQSIKVSISYIRSKTGAADFGITHDFLASDIFIHVPKAGIPKDGPSAGVAFTTAVISFLKNKAIPKNIGMTGEILLNGEVSDIGGLQEKILAAHRKGLKKIFVPEQNYEVEKEDIPPEIKNDNDFEISPVKNYQEIYDALFK